MIYLPAQFYALCPFLSGVILSFNFKCLIMPWSPAECYKNIKAESFYLQFLKTNDTNYSAMDEKIISERQPFKYLKVFNLFKGSVGLEHSLNASKNLMKVRKFPKSKHFLLPDTHMCVCLSGGKKCSFFGKFGVLCLL